MPSTRSPTTQPTSRPTTATPTMVPTAHPTLHPTRTRTTSPTAIPTAQPSTRAPTKQPSAAPTRPPTLLPTTLSPTNDPTAGPTAIPTLGPTKAPTTTPSTRSPTYLPTSDPTTTSPVTAAPTTSPTKSPSDDADDDPVTVATYVPGNLINDATRLGLLLSEGLTGRALARVDRPVVLPDGGRSTDRMHASADGAGVIADTQADNVGGWYYVSNSEADLEQGGVGALRFNALGQVIGYERLLTGTSRNCGGGVTYWGTWVSCEERRTQEGLCWEVDPMTGFVQQTLVTDMGGSYESFAYDRDDPDVEARFFVTEDSMYGALIRYTPPAAAFQTGNKYDILSTPGGSYDFLVLEDSGKFSWSSNRIDGEMSANKFFPHAEGIDVFDRKLFFVSKHEKKLFELDLAQQTWSAVSTTSGQFNMPPDQLGRVLGDDDVLYFCEDGGTDSDIHGRDATGQYFTIIQSVQYHTETTGLSFSPDGMFMYVSFQLNSDIFAFWREDGLPFHGKVAGTKYHSANKR